MTRTITNVEQSSKKESFPLINFTKIVGPGGIPVYHQRLEGVASVSIKWVMFVGGADDTSVGLPGLFHWFEHVPFRGTKKFPHGEKDKYEITRHGGSVNANTNHERTVYHASAPLGNWKKIFEFVTDLMCQPLLREKDIEAERAIIRQEISDSLSDSNRMMWKKVLPIIWDGHPFRHEVLGTEESLNSMDVSLLKKAHEQYSRTRCVLIIAGDISAEEVLQAVSDIVDTIPDRALSERRAPVSYGSAPILESGKTVIESPLHGSKVVMGYQTPGTKTQDGVNDYWLWDKLSKLFTTGGLYAPLMRTVREERQLVYGTGTFHRAYVDGGHWGFTASAKPGDIEKIIDAFHDVLRLPELRENERHEYTNDRFRGGTITRLVDPGDYTYDALSDLMNRGRVISEQEWLNKITSISPNDTNSILDTLTPERARVFIFKGRGS